MRGLIHRLVFTKDGDLDLGWVILLIAFLNGILVWDFIAFGKATMTPQGWVWYGAVTTMAFISGVSIAKARLIAKVTEEDK